MTDIYDELAGQYSTRSSDFLVSDLVIVGPFSQYLRFQFPEQEVNCLEIGSGAGLNARMLTEDGFSLTVVERSTEMCRVTREMAPAAKVFQGDFLEFDFGDQKFHGIFAKAVLHLFCLSKARQFLQKCASILRAKGILYIAVSEGDIEAEGFQAKEDYRGDLERFKRVWTAEALQREITDCGLKPIYCSSKRLDPKGKRWLSMWSVRGEAD